MLSTPVRLLVLTVLAAACEEGLAPSPTGTIEITSVTDGEPVDPDGYTVAIDARRETLGANATITVPEVAPGEHQLELLGVAPNCHVTGENPRTIKVEADLPLRLTLEIACASGLGRITVRTQTIGPNVDPDGYTIQLDAAEAGAIDLNRYLIYSAVPAGEHTLLLSGLATNCSVAGTNPRTLAVTAGADTLTTFAVVCRSTGPGTLLITSDRSGESHVYRIRPDGSELRDLTPGGSAVDPDWSPDLTRIAFASTGDGGVYVMLADGSHQHRVATGIAPVWSPDGAQLAYTGPEGVTVVNADGSHPTVLAAGYSPAWSPDGTMIAFNRQGQCVADICGTDLYVMQQDGTGARNLTPSSEFPFDQWRAPSWSPDGSLIAFTRYCCFLSGASSGVGTVQPIGGTPSLVYRGSAAGKPVWSPDGSTLAFAVRQEDGTTELMLMPSRGGAPATLTSGPGSEYPGSWK